MHPSRAAVVLEPSEGTWLARLANLLDPEVGFVRSEVFTPAFVAELGERYPEVGRTRIVTQAVIQAELRRLREEQGEITAEEHEEIERMWRDRRSLYRN
jgi:hypothetical protein